tara:strand:- start:306 stop:1175 length:870 start_codon:yes stop_codon:yes gene_type:complete
MNIISGRILYGNSAGLNHNISGSITKFKTKKIIPKKNAESKLAQIFKKQGYATLDELFDPNLISKISKKFDQLIEDDKYSYSRSKVNGKIYSRGLYRGFEFIPESAELVNDKVKDLIENYYQGHFKVNLFLFSRNYHVPNEILDKHEVYANRWHCDESNSTFVKMFVYLSDVTEKHGPFHVQSKSRTTQLMKMGFGNRSNYNVEIEELENKKYMTKPTGKSGTTFICNCQLGLHRAGIPDNGLYRDAICISFSPSDKPLPKNWIEFFEDPLEPISKNKYFNTSLRHRNV